MNYEIITVPAVTQERTVMVPKTETVIVTPETKALTLTLDAKEAKHIFDILGGRYDIDSELGATGDSSFEYKTWEAIDLFLSDALPGHTSNPRDTESGCREVARNTAFRKAGGYTGY